MTPWLAGFDLCQQEAALWDGYGSARSALRLGTATAFGSWLAR